jgi:hypothetical protein
MHSYLVLASSSVCLHSDNGFLSFLLVFFQSIWQIEVLPIGDGANSNNCKTALFSLLIFVIAPIASPAITLNEIFLVKG